MKIYLVVALAATASAFQAVPSASTSNNRGAALSVATINGAVDISELTGQRDVFSLQQWAQNCGAQQAPGLELTTQDGSDWSLITTQPVQAGTPVLFVPAQMILNSDDVQQELGGNLEAAENALAEYEGTRQRLPLFRLMIKILLEWEKGQESPYFYWLNSLPRRFYNGVAMTGKYLIGLHCSNCSGLVHTLDYMPESFLQTPALNAFLPMQLG